MNFLRDFINGTLGPINTVVGIILAVPIFCTWWAVTFGQKRKQKLKRKAACNTQGEIPAILIVDLKPNVDIFTQVLRSRNQDPLMKNVPENRMFRIKRNSWLGPEDMCELVDELRKTIGKIVETGADIIYLLYSGPVAPASIVGAELANTGRVILYQHQEGNYHNWGVLKHLN